MRSASRPLEPQQPHTCVDRTQVTILDLSLPLLEVRQTYGTIIDIPLHPPPKLVAAKINAPSSLASLRATCRWCRMAVNPHVQRLRLAYQAPSGDTLTANCLRRAARFFPNVHHIHLDCTGMQPAAMQSSSREPQLGTIPLH